jgi:hypothetical protein
MVINLALSFWNITQDDPESTPFVSALSINLEGIVDSRFIHVLWGMSKDFGGLGYSSTNIH